MKKALLCLVGIMLLAAVAPGAARAEGDWKFAVTPYLWAAGFDGAVSVKGHDADFEKSFGDIIEDLDFAFMLNLQARKGKLGLFSDVVFLGMSSTASVENPAGATLLEATASTDTWTVDFGASWEATRWGIAGSGSSGFVDVYVGGRYWNVGAELSASSPFFAGAPSVDETLGWVDPVIGARLAAEFSPQLRFVGRADVGGGLGGSTSELTWSASANLGWQFTPLVSAYAGWKYLFVEREDTPDTKVELGISGPALGVAFTF